MKLIKEESTFNTVITPNLECKIRILCSKINQVEWSGIVFYRTEGSIKENNLTIIAEDLILMHKGTSGYTEFEITPDIATYMAMNDLLDLKLGLIHSHNNMSTFYSGTDQATLLELGSKQVHFYSLIVNNAGDYSAAITKRVLKKREVKEYRSSNTFDNKVLDSEEVNYTEESVEDVHYYLLDIEYPMDYKEFNERINKISKESVNSNIGFTTATNGIFQSTRHTSYKDVHKSIYEEPSLQEEIPFYNEEDNEIYGLDKDIINKVAHEFLVALFLSLETPVDFVESKFLEIVKLFPLSYSALDKNESFDVLSKKVESLIKYYSTEKGYTKEDLDYIIIEMLDILDELNSNEMISILTDVLEGYYKQLYY